jgi:hypothetical protein
MGIGSIRQTNDWWGPKQNECQMDLLGGVREKSVYFVRGVTGGGKGLPLGMAKVRRLS